MNVSMHGSCMRVNLMTTLPKAAHDDADRRIAQSLRKDKDFMAELKRFGIYDEDAESVLDDSEVLEA